MRIKLVMPLGQGQERWQTDRQVFLSKARALGAEASLQMTSFVLATKNQQAEQSLIEDVDVLVVIPPLTVNPAPLVELAARDGVKVVAYDRLIMNCPLDLYVSFDNTKVGELQARYLVEHKPRGTYLLIGGPGTDNNSPAYHQGQVGVLKPFLDRGDIKLEEGRAKDWVLAEGYRITLDALNKTENRLDAVLATNDNLAQGAIEALEERGLVGKVMVTGMDAELSACKRMVAGAQSMSVYKPIKLLATAAAEMAVALAQGQSLSGKTTPVPNGQTQVPSLLLPPVLVDKGNLDTTVIVDGFHKKEEIF